MRITPTFVLSLSLLAAACLAACVADDPPTTDDTAASETGARDRRPDVIECRTDRVCPRGSYCETGLNICFTGSRCIVQGRPSDALCERTYGDGFVCFEYAPDSHHCVPTE